MKSESKQNSLEPKNIPHKKTQRGRIFISETALKNTTQVVADLNHKFPGIKLSKNDLVDWLILENFQNLSSTMEKKIQNQFYSEAVLLESAIREIKKRTQLGEVYTLQDFMRDHQLKKAAKRSRSRRKSIEAKISDDPPKEELT